jgi:hypothetical protein
MRPGVGIQRREGSRSGSCGPDLEEVAELSDKAFIEVIRGLSACASCGENLDYDREAWYCDDWL